MMPNQTICGNKTQNHKTMYLLTVLCAFKMCSARSHLVNIPCCLALLSGLRTRRRGPADVLFITADIYHT